MLGGSRQPLLCYYLEFSACKETRMYESQFVRKEISGPEQHQWSVVRKSKVGPSHQGSALSHVRVALCYKNKTRWHSQIETPIPVVRSLRKSPKVKVSGKFQCTPVAFWEGETLWNIWGDSPLQWRSLMCNKTYDVFGRRQCYQYKNRTLFPLTLCTNSWVEDWRKVMN